MYRVHTWGSPNNGWLILTTPKLKPQVMAPADGVPWESLRSAVLPRLLSLPLLGAGGSDPIMEPPTLGPHPSFWRPQILSSKYYHVGNQGLNTQTWGRHRLSGHSTLVMGILGHLHSPCPEPPHTLVFLTSYWGASFPLGPSRLCEWTLVSEHVLLHLLKGI